MKTKHHTHEDGRECWSVYGGDWYYRTSSEALATVTSTKPFVSRCDRPHPMSEGRK